VVSCRGPPASSAVRAVWTAFVESCRPPIVIHVPCAYSVPSRPLTSSYSYRLLVRSADYGSVTIYQLPLVVVVGPSFFICAGWCRPIGVELRRSSPFSRTASDASQRCSHLMHGAVAGRRYSASSFTAPLRSAFNTHSATYLTLYRRVLPK